MNCFNPRSRVGSDRLLPYRFILNEQGRILREPPHATTNVGDASQIAYKFDIEKEQVRDPANLRGFLVSIEVRSVK